MSVEPATVMASQAKQKFQENKEDKISGASGNFKEFDKECTMPVFANRFRFSFKDNLSSYLGSRNPFYTTVDPKTDVVWLFDNTAYQNNFGRWKAEFVAAYFRKDTGKDTSEIVAWISEKVGLAKGDKAEDTIAERVQPLLDSILPAHSVNIDLAGVSTRLGPSTRDGISSDALTFPGTNYSDKQTLTLKAINADATPSSTIFASPTGWAIISDVDDTIKKTLTADPIGILKTTFVEEPEPIKGMPELYKHMTQALDNPAWFYLSASPYNLYPFLHGFRSLYYPPGTMILREASWMNFAGFFANLNQGTQAYKVDRMRKIHEWLPRRKFICIGDSTQTDPESYGEMYRKHPGWIGAIYIRKVKGVAGMDEEHKNDPDRFRKAFKGVPESVWYVFEDPSELYAKVDALTKS
ncbi:hypothetical protein GQ43DRAFT_446394 [Delitschia confertaspora ATCC 74209]|uniref:Phosphatidate phosphatase APP1 catalytic domain-containing protein n=1 Tax=Delitschia confertaspora ATCC 74209 TaxID=1513339 RepID=A0A9P4JWQ6_9PLEO|nr:hypothetical protein GQ43DRAFT_446394 [Delitschia confertaspora ATCC 74209]